VGLTSAPACLCNLERKKNGDKGHGAQAQQKHNLGPALQIVGRLLGPDRGKGKQGADHEQDAVNRQRLVDQIIRQVGVKTLDDADDHYASADHGRRVRQNVMGKVVVGILVAHAIQENYESVNR
jgi:hypothetical protein